MKGFAVLTLLFWPLVANGVALETGGYPFSWFMDWEDKALRQSYERSFTKAGLTIRLSPMSPTGSIKPLAERQQCIFIEQRGEFLGYGIVFDNFFQAFLAENKDKVDAREITLRKAEVIYDKEGRYIFLASYSFRLSPGEMFVAKWILWKEPEADRKIFSIDRPLGEGYELTEPSQRLAKLLVILPETCLAQKI